MSDRAWTYDTISFTRKDWRLPPPASETVWEALSRLGPQGWELVQIIDDANPDFGVVVLKKRVKTKSHHR